MSIRTNSKTLTAIALAAFAASTTTSTTASAQFATTGADESNVLSCFYECKPGPDIQGAPTYRQVTTLPIANNSRFSQDVDVNFIDGNGNVIATTDVSLTRRDVDELAVCNTIEAITGSAPPRAGLVQIGNFRSLNAQQPSGVYSWIKNVSGKFFADNPEPFEGRVQGVAKSECTYVASLEVNDPDTINAEGNGVPSGPPILVEDTDDGPVVGQPDLRPIPGAGGFFCRLRPNGDLEVEIRNDGNLATGGTTTLVSFPDVGVGATAVPTPGLAPGASTLMSVPIPLGCYAPNCFFQIEADRNDDEAESDETNNVALDSCLG